MLDGIEVIERFKRGALVEENIALDPVRKGLGELVVHERACGNGKDVVEFFERALLGLGHPEENHHECQEVQTAGG